MKKFLLAASLAVLVFAGCAGGGEANYYAEVSSEELVVFVAEDISGDMSWRDYFDGLQEEGIITYSMDGSMLAELNGVSNASDYSSCSIPILRSLTARSTATRSGAHTITTAGSLSRVHTGWSLCP